RVPQSVPGSREDTIHKQCPELRESCFNSLADRTDQGTQITGIGRSQQQQFSLFHQPLAEVFAAITQIGQTKTTLNAPGQGQGRIAIIGVGRCQQRTHNQALMIDNGVELEAEEPALLGLAEISTGFTQQSHASVPQKMTDWNRLAIHQVKSLRSTGLRTVENQTTDEWCQGVQPCDPLLVRTQTRKGSTGISDHQLVGAFQSGALERALHQGDGDHFCVAKPGLAIVRLPQASGLRVFLQVLIHVVVDFCQLVIYAQFHGRSPFFRYVFSFQYST